VDLSVLNTWLADNLLGFTYVASLLTVTSVIFAVVSGTFAYRQWQAQSAEMRRVAEEDRRRLETELELRAIEHAQWLLAEVDPAVAAAKAVNRSSGNDGARALISRGQTRGRLVTLDARELLTGREIEPRSALTEVLANADVYGRVLNMLEVFAAKVSNATYNQEKVYAYCAVYFCDIVEDWAPLVAIYRETVDTRFFSDGWELYLRWSENLERDKRRPSQP
jgi:hypothetical protein